MMLRPSGTVDPAQPVQLIRSVATRLQRDALHALCGADVVVRDLVAEDLVDHPVLSNGAAGSPDHPAQFTLRPDASRIRGPRMLALLAIALPFDEDRLESMSIGVDQRGVALLNIGILRAFPREYIRPTLGSSAVQPQPRLGWLSEPVIVDWMTGGAPIEIALSVNAPLPQNAAQWWFGGLVAERAGDRVTWQSDRVPHPNPAVR